MDSIKRSAVAPKKSRLARLFAKLFRAQPAKLMSQDDAVQMGKSGEETVTDPSKNSRNEEDEQVQRKAVEEAFIAKTFASISSFKAAYSQLQFSESPYDGEGVQSSDQIIVSELKNLSELKRCYLRNELNDDDVPPETALALSEIQEQKSLVKLHDIIVKKLDSQLKLKDLEINFLSEKLTEANKENKTLETRLNSSAQFPIPDNTELAALKHTHFVTCLNRALGSITSFVRLLMTEMESADWDLTAAANSIEPGVSFWEPKHQCFAFESFVCRVMFEGFNYPNFFSIETDSTNRQHFFDKFMELKSVRPEDYLARKPKSQFATFCREKYLKLVHPEMELSFFGNLNQRNSVNSNELPEMAPFFKSFIEMAKRLWLLHCLAYSYSPEASVFRVSKGTRFSDVYMESLCDEAFDAFETDPHVAFMVVPGFEISNTIIQCKVYLR